MFSSKRLGLTALVLVLAAAGGCIFSPPDTPPCVDCNNTSKIIFPDTPDNLMKNFQTIYETMDFAEYAKIMHPDYITKLQDATVTAFPDVGPTLDVAEELAIHQHMFSGAPGYDEQNRQVPGIQAISFQTFQRSGAWTLSPPNDEIPNAQFALYDVKFMFDRGQGNPTLSVTGKIKFYVVSRDSIVSGVAKPYYQMRGQVDLTDAP